MKKIILITVILTISISASYTQIQPRITYSLDQFLPSLSGGSGQIYLTSDNRFPSIVKGYIDFLKNRPIKGWRVQIYFGTGHNARVEIQRIRQKFHSEYPDIPIYILFEQPYFKVRVGNFYTRRDAAKFLFLIKPEYPKAFLTEDNIDIYRLTD